jgi:hypothetical protein
MINLKKENVIERLDLETAIYRILSNEEGPSQNELFEKLVEYVEKVEKSGLVLKVNSGNLSHKLKSLEKDEIVLHKMKKMKDRDQDAYSYYIKRDLAAFEHIMKHLAKNIDMALDVTPFNTNDWKKFLEIRDLRPRKLTMGTKCALIDALIKSSYVRQLIGACGFKSVYQIYKKEVNNYCDLKLFIELAKSLVHEGSINDLNDFGPEFISDAESRKKVIEAIDFALSKNQSNP